mgnify:CR=1 FL=1
MRELQIVNTEEQTLVNKLTEFNDEIKSGHIKKLILGTQIELANKYLQNNYKLYGHVSEGLKIGRSIGFPTANINVNSEQIIPSNGVVKINTDIHGLRQLKRLHPLDVEIHFIIQ